MYKILRILCYAKSPPNAVIFGRHDLAEMETRVAYKL